MNITPVQYATALYESIEHVSDQQAQDIIARFAERICRDGQTKNLKTIIEKFIQRWNVSQGIVEAEVVSRIALTQRDSEAIEHFIVQQYRAKIAVITNRVDSTIGGGVIIRVGDDVLDGSVATQLVRLRKQLGAH